MQKTLLIDMDCIVADMLPYWIDKYNHYSEESIEEKSVVHYNLNKIVKYPNVLESIIHSQGFFLEIPPVKDSVRILRKLIKDKRFDVVFLTQPPRKADYAISEKRIWIKKYFRRFDLCNIVFAHRKELVRGDVLFDDKPSHLTKWKAENSDKHTATISYPYNESCKSFVDQYYNKDEAWEKFYAWVVDM